MFVKYRGVWSDKDVGRIISNTSSSKSKKYKIKHQDVIHINSDREHVKVQGVFSKLRITEGTNENRMRVYLTLSGQRIINRIFNSSSNVNGNVKTCNIFEYIPSTAYMIAFILWIVLNCTVEANNKFQDFGYSNIPIFCQYIDEYLETKGNKQPRNVVVNTAISIMLSSKTKEEQEEFINSHFLKSQSQQKAVIRAGLNRINEIKQQVPDNVIPFTERLIKELENAYNW